MAHASFNGLRVLSLESRRAKEIEKLIRTYGGDATVVPSMREVGLESNGEVLEFAAGLLRGEYDLVIFLTGVGVRTMLELVQSRFDREEFLAALRKVKTAARGAKPAKCSSRAEGSRAHPFRGTEHLARDAASDR